MTEKEKKDDNIVLGMDAPEEESRALPRARRDVELTEQVYYGKPCYVLKDPTSLRYYRLRPPEYTIFQLLDGENTMDDVLRVLSERFPSEEFDAQTVMSFVIMLRGANLLHINSDQNVDYLLKRKKMMSKSIVKKIRSEFLFFRIPVIDPDKILNGMHATIGKFIFSRFAAILVFIMMIGAVALVIDNIDKFGQRQPLLSWINLLYMGPALLVIKFIHEFGHGLTSKHFNTEVHEMGILFLVFMPCFYCDVSDSWMVNEKRKRMWITAAGIVVEIVLAGLAAYIWALSEPKTVINQFALNVMIAASVNTLLFNGNPLLRYDGYYFLMDLVEIPNLKQKGSSYLWYLFQRFVLGVERPDEPIDCRGREFTVLGYAICSAIYRWFIMIAIVTMVWKFLDPYGWGVIGGIMALGCIYTSFGVPIGKFFKYVWTQKHNLKIRVSTAVILVVLIGGTIFGVGLLPVEQTVEAQCILRPRGEHPIYVTQPGFIYSALNETFVQDGQTVKAGDILLKLSDPQLEMQVKNLEIKVKQLETQRDQARQRGMSSVEEKIQAELKGYVSQLERARYNLEKLTLRSPVDGTLQLRSSIPLRYLDGNFVPLQTKIFSVYEPGQFEAVAAVNHRDIELINENDQVQIRLWSMDSETFESKVKVKPPSPVMKMFSPAFSTVYQGEVATMPSTNKEEALEPAENTYELIVPIPGEDMRFREGLIGRAKIIVEKKTLAEAFKLWLWRALRQDIRI